MIEAKIIADSVSPRGDRLTTIECRFPRFILPEVNTHRAISKNAQSSRAIPINKRIEEVRNNTATPVHWGKNERGMVANEEISYDEQVEALSVWHEAANAAADYATYLAKLGIHKQVVSRVLEPFLWQTNVMSSTEAGWKNLLNQRDHPDAQPEFRALAVEIREAYYASQPVQINYGEMHLPYITEDERVKYDLFDLQRASVARVARTSYGNQGGFNIEKDLELENRLYWAKPKHYSPYEGPATPVTFPCLGNYDGWLQLRHNEEWLRKRESFA